MKLENRTIEAAVSAAQRLYEREGEIEVDDVPDTGRTDCVSACEGWEQEGGMYVKAWVWVPAMEIASELT